MDISDDIIKILALPDCRVCKGTGTEYWPDKEGDVTAEICDCVLAQLRNLDLKVRANLI